ncbi:farnesol dehydrogenase-like [Bradysia coprophila]|uniref:farnesol dehydrogenase-like n=1 Tax=Bradysia coprophila TaxID=38358 RepID=UPI00187DB364|nr:farnesol dehydrogenase-like [Bradysia coprophila]
MERWTGKVAIISGASSGIGSAVAVDLVQAGMTVVGLARRAERVDELQKVIPANAKGKLYSLKCDISNDNDVKKAFEWIEKTFGGVHVLVNNAGVSVLTSLTDDGNEDQLKNVIQTNLWGLVSTTKKFFAIVKKYNVVGAHVININSVLGHDVFPTPLGRNPIYNVYPASKFGVTAVTETLRQEFSYHGLKTKVTSISPGLVTTEMTTKNGADRIFKNTPALKPEDISQAVLYTLGTPEHVQVHEITVRPFDFSKLDIKQNVRSKM